MTGSMTLKLDAENSWAPTIFARRKTKPIVPKNNLRRSAINHQITLAPDFSVVLGIAWSRLQPVSYPQVFQQIKYDRD